VLIKPVPTNSDNLAHIGSLVFFTAGDSLWKSDGTEAGSVVIKTGLNNPGVLFSNNGMLYFINDRLASYSVSGKELWRSDGTTAGTYLLKRSDIGDIQLLNTTTGNYNYFSSADATYGRELYRTNGTVAGTFLAKDINPGSGDGVYNPTWSFLGNTFFFEATDPATGTELWKSNGFAVNTLLVKDVLPGAGSGLVEGPFTSGGLIYFVGNDGLTGSELWKTDGSPANTLLVKDITSGSGSSTIQFINTLNGELYFAYFPFGFGSQLQLWKSNGTEAGTSFIYSWGEEFDFENYVNKSLVYHNKLFLILQFGISRQLWGTDGTAIGTYLVKSPIAIDGDVHFFGVVNNLMIFDIDGQGYFTSFYRSDGTPGGTTVFYSYNNPSGSRDYTIVGNKLYFEDHDGPSYFEPNNADDYVQLMVTNGYTTESVRSIYGISLAGTDDVINANGTLYFTTYNPSYLAPPDQHIKKLWKLNPSGTSCASSGKIFREFYNGIMGSTVASIPTTSAPTSTSLISNFEGPVNIGNNYGAVYKGYICAPVTGNYTFWIASDDNSELWLSTNADSDNKVLIANVAGWTNFRQWNKYASQQSAPIHLQAGRRYYIEALHKEAYGNDNLSVGWQLPGGVLERPIPGTRLSPFNNLSPSIVIASPSNGSSHAAPANLQIQTNAFDPDGNVTKVEFYNGSMLLGTDFSDPFNFNWYNIQTGNYNLTAKAYDNDGAVSTSSIVTISVTNTPCVAQGYISWEVWTDAPGSTVASIPLTSDPTITGDRFSFESLINWQDNYGQRLRGYICAPMTGNYVFWIASDDNSELWLSTDGNPAHKVRIAYINGWTNSRQWNKYGTQQSAPISLIGGRTYYIEALHKEAYGGDNLAVGWMLPDATLERPIPGSRLSPYDFEPSAVASKQGEEQDVSSLTNLISVSIVPNPTEKGLATIYIEGRKPEGNEILVEVKNLQGQVIHSENVKGENLHSFTLPIDQKFNPGIYLVQLIIDGQLYIERLIVE